MKGYTLVLCLALAAPIVLANIREQCEEGNLSPGYYPHSTYCNKFYSCVFETIYEHTCVTPFLWNNDIQNCDYPENVDCGDLVIPQKRKDGVDEEELPQTAQGTPCTQGCPCAQGCVGADENTPDAQEAVVVAVLEPKAVALSRIHSNHALKFLDRHQVPVLVDVTPVIMTMTLPDLLCLDKHPVPVLVDVTPVIVTMTFLALLYPLTSSTEWLKLFCHHVLADAKTARDVNPAMSNVLNSDLSKLLAGAQFHQFRTL
uniref:Uncharacterized protein n=1 Tax=Phlebotomus papatasi TaxID=29031 RepID=A0A1B0D6Q9_PHLPP